MISSIFAYRCTSQRINLFDSFYSIPDYFWRIQSLKQLYISGNGLKGSLDVFSLPNINELSISNNRISGTLPEFFKIYRPLKVFDIANNRFKGYFDVNVNSTGDPGNMIKADVNRFSGRLNNTSVDTFDDITVLTGNLISCATLPTEDSSLNTYICETSNLQTAVITWLVVGTCFLVLVAFRFNPWYKLSSLAWIDSAQNLVQFHKGLPDHVKVSIPLSVQFIYALLKLLELSFVVFVALIFVTMLVYCGFKLGEGNEKFKSHTDQYLYLMSGVYLRSAGPACALFVVYVVSFVLLMYVFNRLFVFGWITSSTFLPFVEKVDGPTYSHSDRASISFVVRSIACLIFLGLSLVVNGLYIIVINRANDTQLVLAQIMLSFFNILYQTYGIPLLVAQIFPMQSGHTASSSLVYTAILIIVDVINPCIAIIFTDDLCLKQLVFSKQTVSVSYQRSICDLTFTPTHKCVSYSTEDVSYTVPLPFIFSNQCRTAMFKNYIPTILYSCAYSTFVSPIMFLLSTCKTKSLDEELSLLGFRTSMRKRVLSDVTYSFVLITEELMLLLFYGIVSPFCAVALWASVASRILLLRFQVYRYYLLQSEDVSKIGSLVRDKNHIEVMCGTALKYSHIYIQPGMTVLSLMFGLYLFEMAYDTDDSSLTVSMCLLVLLTCTTLTVQVLTLWSRRARLVSLRWRMEAASSVPALDPPDSRNNSLHQSLLSEPRDRSDSAVVPACI